MEMKYSKKKIILPHGWTTFSKLAERYFSQNGFHVVKLNSKFLNTVNSINWEGHFEQHLNEEAIVIIGPLDYLKSTSIIQESKEVIQSITTLNEYLRGASTRVKLITILSLASIFPRFFENSTHVVQHEWKVEGMTLSNIHALGRLGSESIIVKCGIVDFLEDINEILSNKEIKREYFVNEKDIISQEELFDAISFFTEDQAGYIYGNSFTIDKGVFIQ
ncbi:hypothetical protein [Rossellomorea sp. LjRoot5]|uniref:hypothetical protein n=1 Tax=Rossellomorea sp. LjRoot5 TaxID=3342331 RepID=UPI003ED06661